MTSSNLDLVRSIYADWERGAVTSADWADPAIEFVVADGPLPGSWTGVAGMAASVRDFLRSWEEFRVAADEYRELDDERVVVLDRRAGRGTSSELEVDAPGATLFHVSGGKVTRLVRYWDREHALADLGLSPEPEAPGS